VEILQDKRIRSSWKTDIGYSGSYWGACYADDKKDPQNRQPIFDLKRKFISSGIKMLVPDNKDSFDDKNGILQVL